MQPSRSSTADKDGGSVLHSRIQLTEKCREPSRVEDSHVGDTMQVHCRETIVAHRMRKFDRIVQMMVDGNRGCDGDDKMRFLYRDQKTECGSWDLVSGHG